MAVHTMPSLLGDYWILFPYKTTCPTYLPYRCGTNNLLPGTFQNHRLLLLTVYGLISLEKFFTRFFSRYKLPCYMGKCKRYESNIPQHAYKACPITAWVLLQSGIYGIRTHASGNIAFNVYDYSAFTSVLPLDQYSRNGISTVCIIFFVPCITR